MTEQVSYISLGCPKALVDSEHIVSGLQAQGYEVVGDDGNSSTVVINTCGFIDAAKQESFDAIEQALDQYEHVVVTGCLGADRQALIERYPQLKHVSGPADAQPVLDAVGQFVPAGSAAAAPLSSGHATQALERVRLTPPHYAYLKISEGCNHSCQFCIIPDMRGPLVSRPLPDVLDEAQQAVEQGAQELLVIAQDLSAYGLDLRYATASYQQQEMPTDLYHLCEQLGQIAPWVRLHYVYPYPHVDRLIPLMADGHLLPYLDMPLQHGSPKILKAMRRPAAAEKTLERIHRWRDVCPELAIRSTFIVGFPGETDEDVGQLLDFLHAAQLDRVGCFTYSAVDGAKANALPDHVDERDKLDRQEAVYELQSQISHQRLTRHVGRTLRVLIDGSDETTGTVIGRSMFDAPEIDGVVHIQSETSLRAGEFVWVEVTSHDDHDLHGQVVGHGLRVT